MTKSTPSSTRKPTEPDLMARTRAAVAYVSIARSQEHHDRLALHAFMALFHPDKKLAPSDLRD